MTRPRRTALAVALAALALAGATACGGDDDEPVAAGTAAATGTAPATDTTAAATGECADGELPTADPASRGPFDAPGQVVKAGCDYAATIATEWGDIEVELDADAAPVTTNSFVFLATQGYFDGLTFHRTVPGFVIQGGDPTGTGTGGPGYTLPDELPASPGYEPGALAMANAGPDTGGSQFFIVTGDGAADLPNDYARFGTVTSGLEAAQEIEALGDVATQEPSREAVIESVRITESPRP